MKIETKFFPPNNCAIAFEISKLLPHTNASIDLNDIIKSIKNEKANKIGYSKTKLNCNTYGPFELEFLNHNNYILQNQALNELLNSILNSIPSNYILTEDIYRMTAIIKKEIENIEGSFSESRLYLFNKSYATYHEQLKYEFEFNEFDYFFSIILISKSVAYFITIWYD